MFVNVRLSALVFLLCTYVSAVVHAEDEEASQRCIDESSKKNSSFDSLSTQFSGGTTLVTSEIFKGYTAFSKRKSKKWYRGTPKAIGIRATASVPAITSTESDYADNSLLLQDGALVGVTFSFMGSPYWPHWYSVICDKSKKDAKWSRKFSPDRHYLARHPVTPMARAYFLHGITLKAIKSGLVDNDNDNDGSDIDGAGTIYFGLGLDGPISIFESKGRDPGSIGGTIDFNFGWKKTWISEGTLQTLYKDDSIRNSSFEAIFASLRVQVTNKFYVDIEHVATRGSREYIDDVTSFKLGYSLDKN